MMKKTVIVFAIFFGLYCLSVVWLSKTQTPSTAYFNELAESFLRGKLFLENPDSAHDLTLHDGKWYVPFLPLPAFLMLPFAALGNVNTVLFSIMMGALNVTLVFLITQLLRGDSGDNFWLAILFGVGSVHWYISTTGSVWFVSQICTVTFMALSVYLALKYGNPLLAGLSLGAAMWARPHVVLMYPLLMGIGWSMGKRFWNWNSLSAVPVCLSVVGILFYNYLRFDNPLDFGYLNENVSSALRSDLLVYGQFSTHYVQKNIQAMVLALPNWNGAGFIPDGAGMSLLITSPAILFIAKADHHSPIVWGALVSVLLILVPLLTYYNTGWYQFGYRFSLDFMIPIMVILSTHKITVTMKSLIGLGVLVNLWGLSWWYQV